MDTDQPRYGCCNALVSAGHSIACEHAVHTTSHVTAPAPQVCVTDDQPPPVQNARAAIQDLVVADLALMIKGPYAKVTPTIIPDLVQRKKEGIEKYGTPLQAFNGRNATHDAYQEIIDYVQYAKQKCEESLESKDHKNAGRWALLYTKAIYLLCETREALA